MNETGKKQWDYGLTELTNVGEEVLVEDSTVPFKDQTWKKIHYKFYIIITIKNALLKLSNGEKKTPK